MEIIKNTVAFSDKLLDRTIQIRQYLHENPELSGQEFQTTQFIQQALEKLGISVLSTSLTTGVIAEIGPSTSENIVALRADIDALPIQEAASQPFASKNEGVMHACGHDFHTAALLGAAEVLKEQEEQLTGKIRLIFQPAEEINKGAKAVIEAGGLDKVKAILGFHNKPDLSVGTIGLKKGPLMAGVEQFKVEIKGTGTHAAAPHNGSDPVVTACQIVTSLQSIVSRHISPVAPAVLSVTRIDGGNTWNVIPEKVILEGTIRTFSENDRQVIKQLFEQIVVNYTVAVNQKSTIEWIPSPPALINHEQLHEIVSDTIAPFMEIVTPEITMGGEDFANYQQEIPGFFAFIGTDSPYEWHHPDFQVDDSALIYGIRYYVQGAIAVLREMGE